MHGMYAGAGTGIDSAYTACMITVQVRFPAYTACMITGGVVWRGGSARQGLAQQELHGGYSFSQQVRGAQALGHRPRGLASRHRQGDLQAGVAGRLAPVRAGRRRRPPPRRAPRGRPHGGTQSRPCATAHTAGRGSSREIGPAASRTTTSHPSATAACAARAASTGTGRRRGVPCRQRRRRRERRQRPRAVLPVSVASAMSALLSPATATRSSPSPSTATTGTSARVGAQARTTSASEPPASAAASAGSHDPSSPANGCAVSVRPAHGTPAESVLTAGPPPPRSPRPCPGGSARRRRPSSPPAGRPRTPRGAPAPTASQCSGAVTYIRVRTTCARSVPASRSTASTVRSACRIWPYPSPGWTTTPSTVAVVPASSTRPSSVTRARENPTVSSHGLYPPTRLTAAARHAQRLRQRERPRVERLADDRPLDSDADEPAQRGDVVERRDAAAGDDRLRRPRAHLAQQVEVRPAEGAVLGHVGDDVPRAPVGVQPRQRLPQVAALAGPAAGGERRPADVEADGDPVAPGRDRARGSSPGSPAPRSRGSPGRSRWPSPPPGSRRPGCRRTAPRARRACRRRSASSSRLLPRPNAASRSTRWIHSAPSDCHASAASSGSP